MSAHRPHEDHGVERLCSAGTELYARALRAGELPAADAGPAPCLIRFGLLHPAVDDLDRLVPVAPAVALHRLLRSAEDRVADERRREAQLVDVFEPLLNLEVPPTLSYDSPALRVLSGTERINEALTEAVGGAAEEMLCIQPYVAYPFERLLASRNPALHRDQALLDRGGLIRTIYQHTQRHSPYILAYNEQLRGDMECRTLDEVTDRLIVIDREVAFIPADGDRQLALEIRHPAVVRYLATAFDRLWRLATPMHPEPARQQSTLKGVTPRQLAIAALLIEGHTDAVIADRLGLNIRTAREHIAKLAATLGSESRAQLGYLIGRSGILDQEPGAGTARGA